MKANPYAKRLVSRAALLVQAAALSVCSSSAMAAVIDGPLTNIAVPNTFAGIYINLVTGATGSTAATTGWDINSYGSNNVLAFFWPSAPASSSGGVASPTGTLTPLSPGATVSSASSFTSSTAASLGSGFQGTQDAYLGFRFFNEATGAINYGYARFTTTAPNGFPATLVCYRYENSGAAITVAACGPAAPTLTYTPTTAAGVTFPTGLAGPANATIAISSSGAVGTGQSAVTGCAISGPGAGAFGAVTTTPAGGVFNSGTTSGSINLSCTRGASASTATLSCTETATPGSPLTRSWALTCPAVTPVAPVAAVAPTTLTAGSGSVTPTITTPAQGTGSTVFGCSIPATAPSNFAITSNATQTLTTGAPLPIGLSCVPQAAATTATLTCTQTATPGPNPADATALITCPAAPAAAPTLTYSPTTAAGVTFPAGAAGSVNATIAISSSGAVGIGQSAVTGCAISGPGAGAFGLVTTTPAGGVFNSGTTSGSINLSCTRGASASTATLSCTETATPTVAGSPFTRSWALTCPAVTPVAPVAAVAPTTLTAGSGSVTPTITTPAQGTGSTVFGCSIPATAPSNFAITSNATQTLTTGAPLPIGLSCVPQAAATTATLTCTQTATPGPNPANATALITCPAAPVAAPTLTYTPGTALGVTFPSGGVGSANATIAISSTGAVGVGQSAVTGCTISGAGSAAFGAVSTTPANGVFNTGTTSGSINLSCTRGASVASASLSCTETATPTVAGSPFTRTWALTCPAITAVVNPGTASGTILTLPAYTLPSGSSTTNLSFTSVGNSSVLTCTTTGAGFSVAPSPLNLAADVPGTVTVTYAGSAPGTFTGNLNCTSSTTGGPFNYPLSVAVGTPVSVPVPALSVTATWILILSALGFGLFGLRVGRRD